jgi:hypothetical protein
MIILVELICFSGRLERFWKKNVVEFFLPSDPVQEEKWSLDDQILKVKQNPHFFEDPQGLIDKLEKRLDELRHQTKN